MVLGNGSQQVPVEQWLSASAGITLGNRPNPAKNLSSLDFMNIIIMGGRGYYSYHDNHMTSH
jgi:hypothetical protein